MRPTLTPRQNETLEFIRSYLFAHRKPPTLQEMAKGLGVKSVNAVLRHLDGLEKKGFIKRTPDMARGIDLLTDDAAYAFDEQMPSLILISPTPSDQPEQLRRRPRGALTIDPLFLRGVSDYDNCLIGRSGDDGMKDDGIFKGDYIVVEERDLHELPNDILVACLVQNAFLVRRYAFVNGRIHLRPNHSRYTAATFKPEDTGCYVIGRVRGILRML